MPDKDKNRALIKSLNKSKPKKPMSDFMKVVIMTLIAMTIVTIVLVWVGNFELPDFGGASAEDGLEHFDFIDNSHGNDTSVGAEELIEHVFYWEQGGTLELPVKGATGWAAASLVLRAEANTGSASRASLSPGDAFTIMDGSVSGWWYVKRPNGTEGWVEIRRCFINLPDVLPSIVYNVTNARSSIFHSSGIPMDGVSYERLYEAYSYNERLGREEYIVPSMYNTAQALFRVQQSALANGETLIVYEVFRPRATQRRVADALNALVRENDYVASAFIGSWSVGNFISQGRSNHQLGASVDSSIAVEREREIIKTGDYSYINITSFRRVGEPSSMHELSPWAVLPSRNRAEEMGVCIEIYNMRSYFESAGFNPIGSEWWHFDHRATINIASSVGIAGEFFTPVIYSVPPTA
jgi:D-alanyl-D-alanine dipeptidase